jgi:hypothetical protein
MPDMVISLSRFAQTIPAGSPEHIWLGPLKAFHGAEKHTASDWRGLIAKLKTQPVGR